MLCVEILYQDLPASTSKSEGAELYGCVLRQAISAISESRLLEGDYHHEEHEGHKVKLDCKIIRDIRVLCGR